MVAAVPLRQLPVTLYGANDPYLAPPSSLAHATATKIRVWFIYDTE